MNTAQRFIVNNPPSFPVWNLDLLRRLTLLGKTLWGCRVAFAAVSDPDGALRPGQNLPHALFILMLTLNGEGAEVALAEVESLDVAAGCIHQLEHGLWGLEQTAGQGHRIYHRRKLCWISCTLFFKNTRMIPLGSHIHNRFWWEQYKWKCIPECPTVIQLWSNYVRYISQAR